MEKWVSYESSMWKHCCEYV